MYTILLPVDKDVDRGLGAAEFVTRLPRGSDSIEVVVLNVFEEIQGLNGDGVTVDSEELYRESSMPDSVNAVVDRLEDEGIEVSTRREHGEPAEQIVDVAAEIDADVIVMAGRKRTPVGKVLFGSVAQSVLLSTERPVTVITRE